MICQCCKSKRILSVNGKCSDLCFVRIGEKEKDGYVPNGLNIGGGDNIEFEVCLDCGQLQGVYPVPKHELEQ